jgi:hypothetical protein
MNEDCRAAVFTVIDWLGFIIVSAGLFYFVSWLSVNI